MLPREGTSETTVHSIDEQTPISDLDSENAIANVAVIPDKSLQILSGR
jgi:hypothetical protein